MRQLSSGGASAAEVAGASEPSTATARAATTDSLTAIRHDVSFSARKIPARMNVPQIARKM